MAKMMVQGIEVPAWKAETIWRVGFLSLDGPGSEIFSTKAEALEFIRDTNETPEYQRDIFDLGSPRKEMTTPDMAGEDLLYIQGVKPEGGLRTVYVHGVRQLDWKIRNLKEEGVEVLRVYR